MSTTSFRTSAALFGLSTLLFNALAAAQPSSEWTQPAAATAEPSAQPAPAPATPNQAAPSQPETPAAPGASNATPAAAAVIAPEPNPAAAAAPDDGPQTLFQSKSKMGGYGGFDVAYTRLVSKDAVLLCGGGALLVDHRFSLGLVGCGNATRLSGQDYGNVVHESGDRLEFGYGGLVIGYQFFPKQLYNLSLSAMIGGGGTAIVNTRDTWRDDDASHDHDHVKTHDALFVAEPRLTAYVNLTRWARMGVFAGYRFVSGVDMQNLSNSDLSGPVLGGTVQFGWF